MVNPLRPDPTNGQTQSNYLLAIADEFYSVCLNTLWDQDWKGWKPELFRYFCKGYLLQSLQGHSCGRQFFIPDLNESRESEFFRSTGSISHILGPRKLSDSEP